MADLCNFHFAGKQAEARKLYYPAPPLCHALFYETNPAPAKAALAMMGKISSEEVRLPLTTMSEANRNRLRKDLESTAWSRSPGKAPSHGTRTPG